MIDALATQRHYRDHIQPVWDALPDKGTFYTKRAPQSVTPVLVASYTDLIRAAGRPIVYMEHGAGQVYGRAHPSYAGGRGKERVVLFLSPSERVAELNRARYPLAAHAVIGCPKLDRYVSPSLRHLSPTVAISFHWNAVSVAPEARSAFRHFEAGLASLVETGWTILGHGHPRIIDRLRPAYEALGIEVVTDFAEVLARADVYAVDNSSTLFEFAAVGRPVVVLNAPWYRRDVQWGLRFWDSADVGVQVDHPDDLVAGITEALQDKPVQRRRRAQVVGQVYGVPLGQATQAAVDAIGSLGRMEAAA